MPVFSAILNPETVNRLIEFLVNPAFAWMLVFCILVLALVLWLRLTTRMARAVAQVNSATATLKSRSNHGQFGQNLDDIDRLMSVNPLIGPGWGQFTDHLLHPPDRSVVKSGREPQYYFNDSLLSGAGLNLRFYHAVPSYLVGLGLIFTFMGLSAALYFASTAFDQDPRTIQMAVQNLLKAAAFKFTTSIAGLGSSLLFSYGIKYQLMAWQLSLDRFCSELQRAAPVVSMETLTYENLVEQQKQTVLLEKVRTDLAGQMATALDAKLQESLVRLVDPLTAQIGQITQRMLVVSQDAVRDMVAEFRAQLFAAGKEQIQQLYSELESTNHGLEQLNSSITQSAQYFSREMARATSEVYQKISEAASSFDRSLNPLHDDVRSLSSTFAAVDDRFKSQLSLFTAAIEGMHRSLEEFRKTARVLEGVSGPIHRTALELEAVAARIRESNESSMHAMGELAKFSGSLNKTALQTREAWDAYRERFEKVDEDLKGVVDQLGRGFRNYHDIVESFMKQLDHSLAKSSTILSASVAELAETLQDGRVIIPGPKQKGLG